jgi:N-carbamoyl-L-amino-acid hydrolase
MPGERLIRAVEQNIALAEDLFGQLRENTKDVVGITRPSYGEGEHVAHRLIAEAARSIGLNVKTDYAGNLYITLPGEDRRGHGVITGSHLDSVPRGGNFDGAAGVVAGLVALAALRETGLTPACDVTVMAIRGEEDDWFAVTHIGSRAALGLLPVRELDTARRFDTGRTLAEHIATLGFDVDALRQRRRYLDPARVNGFFELHIEQGPVLEDEGVPVGIVTGIRGNVRTHRARCLGTYAHSGAVPRRLRADAVMAMAEYVHALEREWVRIEAEGGDLVLTFGKFHTDAQVHALTKVPGEVCFSIDARSQAETILDRMEALIRENAEAIGQARKVHLDLGSISRVKPAVMDAGLRARLREGCRELGITAIELPSGAGHDAADFANAGVPTAMIFVRNANGSHNPDEDMDMADFALGTRLLAWALAGSG